MTELNSPNSEIILYQTEDGQTKLEVRLEDETVWLAQGAGYIRHKHWLRSEYKNITTLFCGCTE